MGDNLLKNGLFYFRDPPHHNWVSKNIQKGQRGEQKSTIIIANNLVALYIFDYSLVYSLLGNYNNKKSPPIAWIIYKNRGHSLHAIDSSQNKY